MPPNAPRRRTGSSSRPWLVLATLASACATPTPPPGPGCDGDLPAANTSGLQPDCPNDLTVHNASCAMAHVYTADPIFHPMDACFGENDPNGPFVYNGVYHLFYQDHVAGGVVGGHLASDDLIKWRRLEVGLWNDQWYFAARIFRRRVAATPRPRRG